MKVSTDLEYDGGGVVFQLFFFVVMYPFSPKLIFYNILIVQRDRLWPGEEAGVVGGGGGLEARLVLRLNSLCFLIIF